MNVSVFGLGCVGCVSAACLARSGHSVTGVDVNPGKVAMIVAGRTPVVEPGLDALLSHVAGDGRLTATTDGAAAVARTDVAMICVGTPGLDGGQPDTASIAAVGREIGRALAGRREPFTVLLRSTCVPGTTEQVLLPALRQEAGPQVRLQVAVNPEFMREGSALQDFATPSCILVGCDDPVAAALVRSIYADIAAPLVVTSFRTAEAVKIASNAFHALKVSFANEIAAICQALDTDGSDVMRIVAMDRKLNLSEAYLRPGFAFGGSCLTKDVRALVWAAAGARLDVPLLSAILPSNDRVIQRAIEAILQSGKHRVGVAGLAFKAGTDDLRESPVVTVVEALVDAGRQVRVLDRGLDPTQLMGANRRYVESRLPHFASLLSETIEAFVDHAEILVVGTATEDSARAVRLAKAGCVVFDLSSLVLTPPM
jgi:GDP-mannose 6-dehydrogenase